MSAFSAIGEQRDIEPDEYTPGIEPQPTWCPGCGDFGVLKALKGALPEAGRTPDETLTVTGIGCSGKLNSYFNSYGFHTIHGRSLPVARAAKLANPGLEVIAAGGDGVRPLSLSLNAGASFVARTAAVNPNQAKELIKEAIEHDGFAHIDFLTQCPTWNKDAKQYVPYIDVNESDDYEFDPTNRDEAAAMMRETEEALHEGKVLTGKYYVDEDRPSYQQEKQQIGEMPDEPLAERYFDDDYDWERSADMFIDDHK